MTDSQTAESLDSDLASAHAVARFVRVSPPKARRVVDLIRHQRAADAVDLLQFAPQAASEPVRKVLQSAMANAENLHGVDIDELWVALAYVDQGPTMKRWRPRAQGRPGRILKRTSHITVVVEHRPNAAAEGNSQRSRKNRRTR